MRACHRQVKRDSPRRVTLKTYDDGLVGLRSKDSPRELCVADTIGNCAHGVLQIKLAAVFARLSAFGKIEKQIAQWHVRLLVLMYSQHLLCSCLCIAVFASLELFSNRGKMHKGFGIVVTVGTTAPERVFVQLKMLLLNPSINHGPKPPVTYGQCLGPFGSWLCIPELQCS